MRTWQSCRTIVYAAEHEHRHHEVAAALDDQGQVRLHCQALHPTGINLGWTNRMDSS
jgi:hypothetical protein